MVSPEGELLSGNFNDVEKLADALEQVNASRSGSDATGRLYLVVDKKNKKWNFTSDKSLRSTIKTVENAMKTIVEENGESADFETFERMNVALKTLKDNTTQKITWKNKLKYLFFRAVGSKSLQQYRDKQNPLKVINVLVKRENTFSDRLKEALAIAETIYNQKDKSNALSQIALFISNRASMLNVDSTKKLLDDAFGIAYRIPDEDVRKETIETLEAVQQSKERRPFLEQERKRVDLQNVEDVIDGISAGIAKKGVKFAPKVKSSKKRDAYDANIENKTRRKQMVQPNIVRENREMHKRSIVKGTAWSIIKQLTVSEEKKEECFSDFSDVLEDFIKIIQEARESRRADEKLEEGVKWQLVRSLFKEIKNERARQLFEQSYTLGHEVGDYFDILFEQSDEPPEMPTEKADPLPRKPPPAKGILKKK